MSAVGVSSGSRSASASAALGLLAQCGGLIRQLQDGEYTRPCERFFGSTIGQHVRHSLDHFAAALSGAGGELIDYDRRARATPVESDRVAALAEIDLIARRLADVGEDDARRGVELRVMLTSSGDEQTMRSTLGRELAFASHHAVHHHAMIAAIAGDAGLSVPAGFGKAPSTLHAEHGARAMPTGGLS